MLTSPLCRTLRYVICFLYVVYNTFSDEDINVETSNESDIYLDFLKKNINFYII